MTYEKRFVAFIDILGFKNIVEKTIDNSAFQQNIFAVLNSIKTNVLTTALAGETNIDNVPKEELEEVLETIEILGTVLKSESSVQITHFSDSIVISVKADDMKYVMTVMELIGRVIFKLWNDFNILIRGGITVGDLIHEEGGVLFGPAMVKSYEYETYLAKNPRIIIDERASQLIKDDIHYQKTPMNYLFIDFNGSATVKSTVYKINNGLEINLATSCEYFIRSHHSLIPELKKKYVNCVNSTPDRLVLLQSETSDQGVKLKHQYLLDAFAEHFPT